ncbi:hypothetical protein KDK77_05220, partial [bacterium]|nr:hypothetical protein [bacterium]
LYTDFPINAELVPKIILLAPTFSEQCRRCIPFINFMDIDLISFAATVKHGVEQITFTHLTDASGDKPVFPLNKELDDVREQLKSIADDISEEEIDTFLKFYK